jgi:hypothetical protein
VSGSRVWAQWRDQGLCRRFRAGVSLHSHSLHSRENLAFIPRYAARVPFLDGELRRVAERYRARTGRGLDYTRGCFTPPLPAGAGGFQTFMRCCFSRSDPMRADEAPSVDAGIERLVRVAVTSSRREAASP